MLYQLEALEKWVRMDIHPEILLPTVYDFNPRNLLEFALEEKDRICCYFREKAISGNPASPIGKLVQTHQVGIAKIADTINNYASDYSIPPQLDSFYERVSHTLEEIISFMQAHLPEFFDE